MDELKNQSEEIMAASHGGEQHDQCSNSLTNIVKQLASTGDANDDIGFLPSALIPEPDIIDSCQSGDDQLMLKTVFPVEELCRPVAEFEVKQFSSCSVSMPNPECDEKSITQRCDEAQPITTMVKPKRRSVWKRTKNFFRRLFCCDSGKVQRSSSGILVEPTDSVDDKIYIGSLLATKEPALIDSPRSAENFPSQTILQVEESEDLVETNVNQSGCEPTDLPMNSQVEEFNDPIETDIQQSSCDPIKTDIQQSSCDPIKTDVQQSSCDPEGLLNKGSGSDLVTTKTKPKRRTFWKCVFCCAC